MELDFQTVKALSSPTRVDILRQVLKKESTPTQLSNELGKSKSTVSSHLNKLTEAELLEKDEVEGRKRVTYRPTRKAEAIVEGRERKVKFSIASSAVTSVAGLAMLGYGAVNQIAFQSSTGQLSDRAGSADTGDGSMGVMSDGAESADSLGSAAANASEYASEAPEAVSLFPEEAFLYMGVGFLGIAALSMLYGLIMRKLGK